MSQENLLKYVDSDPSLESMVLRIAFHQRFFTADDLHVLEPEIARRHRDKRVLGAVLASLKKKGLIQECGYVKSRRVQCHNRPVMTWRIKEHETSPLGVL